MLIGYARVSTVDQDAALKRDALEGEGCEAIFEEKGTGRGDDHPQLTLALERMGKGDVLVVWRLDRLARSMKQLIEIVTVLEAKGVQLRSIIDKIDTGAAKGRSTFHIFRVLAAFEHELIRERTTAGLQVAWAQGRKAGRPKSLSAEDLNFAETMLANKLPVNDVAAKLGVSRSTLYRQLKHAREETRVAGRSVESPLSDEQFAGLVKRLVKGRSTKPLNKRVAIAEAYDLGMDKGFGLGTLDEFKTRLAIGAREGFIDLERCEVVGALPKEVLERSHMRLGRDERHLIVSEDL